MNAALWLLAALLCCLVGTGAALAEEPRAGEPVQHAEAGALIDLNHASLAELTQLPGIGQKRAEAIVAFREAHGGFQSIAQLMKIKGIGRAMLRKLRPLVTISAFHRDEADGALAQAGARAGGSRGAHRVR